MEQLLSITSVPMKYELSVTSAKTEWKSQQSQVMEQRVPGSFRISHRAAKLNLNTVDARNSMMPATFVSIKQAAQKGTQNVMDVSARYAMEGKQFMDAKPGEDAIGQIIRQRSASATGEFQMGFIPTVGPEIQYQEADFRMQYEADKLQFDVRVESGNLEYIPGDISMKITQWPDVVIEYMGKPMYVPPSAAEKFEASA